MAFLRAQATSPAQHPPPARRATLTVVKPYPKEMRTWRVSETTKPRRDPKLKAAQEPAALRKEQELAVAQAFTLRQAAELYLQSRRLAATTLANFHWGLDHHFSD
jgi:hypothetical protein